MATSGQPSPPLKVEPGELVGEPPQELAPMGLAELRSPASHNGAHTSPTSEEDNMDFDTDDDDDAKSNHSSSNPNSRPKKVKKGDEQRSHHNVLERKRRDLIKDSFTKLKESVPNMAQGRSSRAQILKQAADFIQSVNIKNQKARVDLDELVRKNKELELRLQTNQKPAPVKAEPAD